MMIPSIPGSFQFISRRFSKVVVLVWCEGMDSCSASVKLVNPKVFPGSKLGCCGVLPAPPGLRGLFPECPLSPQDAAHLESGQPVQYESDVVVYLQECEGLLRQLQVDVQILRDENYYQLEELVFR